MRRIRNAIAVLALAASVQSAKAQVLSPPEILDPQMRELQQKNLSSLKDVASAIASHSFPYRLYFSRTLDLNEAQQQRSDQRSIRFEKFHDQTVVEITANYYAAYPAETMLKEERARRTLDDVIVPMLQAAVPAVEGEEKVQAFAIEIAHHVRKKVLGVNTENPENVAYVLPRAAARQLMAAVNPEQREAALMQGSLFVDRSPMDGWGQHAVEAPVEAPVAAPVAVVKEAAPDLARPDLDRLVHDLDKDAHFVPYAPPVLISFRKGSYLQLSLTTTLQESDGGSQYRMAALAFDEHIAHLIRPTLASLQGQMAFDGIDFSTSVHPAGGPSAVAVEFIFSASALRSYRDFDCTGQQLINLGFVLINGERVSLDLQSAER